MDAVFERTVCNQTFKNVTVDVDGTEFVDCHFENCTLAYSGGGHFLFSDSPIVGCSMVFVDAAERTLEALSVLYQTGMASAVEIVFDFVRNPLRDTKQ